MKPHVFVAMPFGVKQDSRANEIDFSCAGITADACDVCFSIECSKKLSRDQRSWSRL